MNSLSSADRYYSSIYPARDSWNKYEIYRIDESIEEDGGDLGSYDADKSGSCSSGYSGQSIFTFNPNKVILNQKLKDGIRRNDPAPIDVSNEFDPNDSKLSLKNHHGTNLELQDYVDSKAEDGGKFQDGATPKIDALNGEKKNSNTPRSQGLCSRFCTWLMAQLPL